MGIVIAHLAPVTGRRRHPRFRLAAPVDGNLDVREQVAIESWAGREIELISAVPCKIDERVALELAGDGDGQLTGTVLDSRPIVGSDGSIQYRLRVAFDAPAPTAPDQGHRRS